MTWVHGRETDVDKVTALERKIAALCKDGHCNHRSITDCAALAVRIGHVAKAKGWG